MTPIPLLQHRDNLHREIVIYTMKLNQFNDEFDLKLNVPFEFEHSYYRPYSSEGGRETLKIVGVDGSTGDLLCENELGNNRFVYYHELTLEELTRLHTSVLQGEYVLQILN
jgi:hypothetical protein